MHNNPFKQGERDGKRGLPKNNKIVFTEIVQRAYDLGYSKGQMMRRTIREHKSEKTPHRNQQERP